MKIKATLTLLTASFSVIIFFQLLNLFIAYKFPKVEVGYFFTLFSLCKIINLFTDFGSTTHFKREAAIKPDSSNNLNPLILARFIISLFINILISITAYYYYGTSPILLILIFIYHLLEHYNNFLVGLLQAKLMFKEQMISVFYFIFTFLFFFAITSGLFEISLIEIVLILIASATFQYFFLLRKIKFKFSGCDFIKLFHEFKSCFQIGIFEIINSLAPRLIPIILYKSYASFVGAYNLINMVLGGLILIPTCYFSVFYTQIIEYIRERSIVLKTSYFNANIFFLISGIILSFVLYYVFLPLITFIIGDKYYFDIKFIEFIFFIIPFTFINSYHNQLLLALGLNGVVMRINFFHFIAATILFSILIYSSGIRYAFLSYLITEVIFSVIRYKVVTRLINNSLSNNLT